MTRGDRVRLRGARGDRVGDRLRGECLRGDCLRGDCLRGVCLRGDRRFGGALGSSSSLELSGKSSPSNIDS